MIKERYKKCKDNILCVVCKKINDTDMKRCRLCLDADNIRQKNRRTTCLNNKLCIRCGGLNDTNKTNGNYCIKCIDKRRAVKKTYIQKFIKNDICVCCLKNKSHTGVKHCSLCLKKSKQERINDKLLVFGHYGNKCQCCGEVQQEFLTIDHINNDGSKQRKQNRSQCHIYRWIIKNGFPQDLQILCYNCNMGKARNRGMCPHKKVNSVGGSII